MGKGIGVIRMNLDRKAFPGIQDLQQQREAVPVQTGEGFAPEGKHLPQRFAGILPAGDAAFQPGQGGNFQAFAGDILRRILSEKFLQGVAAPGGLRPMAEGGGHHKRTDIHAHSFFPRF